MTAAHAPADFGVVGLAVMGSNLALNIADHGFRVAVHDRDHHLSAVFADQHAAGSDGALTVHDSMAAFVSGLARPRRILLMIRAGAPVDSVLAELSGLLDSGDIVIDGGNSSFDDTARRVDEMAEFGIHFVGAGVSGGEAGARTGPAIMPGGAVAAWPAIAPVLQAIAARAADGTPCCDWVGPGGAGHFVKTVHNGIEYADMQLIAEAYGLMRASGRTYPEMAAAFREWGAGPLDSYLVHITAEILERVDADGTPLVERILDVAGQKGTGRWSVSAGLELGQPVTLIAEAVFARMVSALKDERLGASVVYPLIPPGTLALALDDIRDALHASKIVSYAQGFMALRAASEHHGWSLHLGGVASLWRAGCIIRARFLDDIRAAYDAEPTLVNLLVAPRFAEAIRGCDAGWRRVVVAAVTAGVPVPAFGAALAFFDGYRAAELPANLVQAQRDYFGAHTYERTDRPRGDFFHTDWTGAGGATTSGSYQA